MIHNSDIYYTYKDIYLSKKEELLQGIHSASGLKPHAGQERADSATIAVTTKENAIKKTFGKRLEIPVEYFLKHILHILIDLRKTLMQDLN